LKLASLQHQMPFEYRILPEAETPSKAGFEYLASV